MIDMGCVYLTYHCNKPRLEMNTVVHTCVLFVQVGNIWLIKMVPPASKVFYFTQHPIKFNIIAMPFQACIRKVILQRKHVQAINVSLDCRICWEYRYKWSTCKQNTRSHKHYFIVRIAWTKSPPPIDSTCFTVKVPQFTGDFSLYFGLDVKTSKT